VNPCLMVHASNAGIEEQRLLVAVHGLQLQPDPTTWLCLQTRESFYRACHLRKSRHVRLTMGIHSCNYNIVPFGNPNDLCDDATELDNLEKRQTPCHVSHNMKQQRRKTFINGSCRPSSSQCVSCRPPSRHPPQIVPAVHSAPQSPR
jgi:hypothetical protein